MPANYANKIHLQPDSSPSPLLLLPDTPYNRKSELFPDSTAPKPCTNGVLTPQVAPITLQPKFHQSDARSALLAQCYCGS